MASSSLLLPGTEYKVQQRSEEWYELRRKTLLTSSQFGDAIGVGKGKPYDFFLSLISEDSRFEGNNFNIAHLQHGIDTEIIIREAYELLTGSVVRESGFWIPNKDSVLKNFIGASPDGVVVDKQNPDHVFGLTEFKAPVYKMYSGFDLDKGIPRQYMAQMHGQMAVAGAPWCDFMAICTKTREIMLKRVFFQHVYWLHVSKAIRQFCHTLQESHIRDSFGQDPTDFLAAKDLRRRPVHRAKFPGEDLVIVEDLLQKRDDMFRGPSNVFLSFDLLMGYPSTSNPDVNTHCQKTEKFDTQMEMSSRH